MKKIKNYVVMFILGFSILGCTNTQPTREKTTAEKTAFLIDTIVATAIYNDSNFGVGKSYVKSKSNTNSDTVSTTTYSNGGTNTRTVTKSTTKTKSKGFGFGIGY